MWEKKSYKFLILVLFVNALAFIGTSLWGSILMIIGAMVILGGAFSQVSRFFRSETT